MASTYLTKTFGTAGNRKTWTYSAWFKIGNVSTGAKRLFTSYDGSTATNQSTISLADTIQIYNAPSGSSSINLTTNRLFRDCNAWYHIVVAVDTTQTTGSNRVKLYINGVQETSFSIETYGSQNEDFFINSTNLHTIGRRQDNSQYFDGSMSHIHFIDGTAYDASTFGETDANGVWKIKTSPSVTYGTNGFFILKDGNSVTDQSGNGNNFTVGGGTLTNTEDNPSNVFATFNPLITVWSGVTTLSNGNTTVTNSDATDGSPPTTIGATSGKYYWEMKQENANDVFIGVCGDGFVSDDLANSYSGITSNATTGLLVYNSSGDKVVNGSTSSSFFTSYGSGNIIGIALDLDSATKTVTFYKNGVVDSQGPQNLPTNMQSGAVFGVAIVDDSATVSANFGNGYFGTTAVASAGTNASGIGIFEYDVPAGYTALST
jgi:hypothetical protein